MNEKATIYDYVRMCKTFEDCKDCPLNRGLCYVNLPTSEMLSTSASNTSQDKRKIKLYMAITEHKLNCRRCME